MARKKKPKLRPLSRLRLQLKPLLPLMLLRLKPLLLPLTLPRPKLLRLLTRLLQPAMLPRPKKPRSNQAILSMETGPQGPFLFALTAGGVDQRRHHMIFPAAIDHQIVARQTLLFESQFFQQAAAAFIARHVAGHDPV